MADIKTRKVNVYTAIDVFRTGLNVKLAFTGWAIDVFCHLTYNGNKPDA